jgi:hypothetical protein
MPWAWFYLGSANLIGLQVTGEGTDGCSQFPVVMHELANLLVAVHHGRVIPVAKERPDVLP